MTSAAELKRCHVCAGTGREHDGDAWQQTPCTACEGTGLRPETVPSEPQDSIEDIVGCDPAGKKVLREMREDWDGRQPR